MQYGQVLVGSAPVTAALPSQEYTLAHIDKPDTLAGAEKALKKHEDFVSTMDANEDKIDGALQGGQRLVDNNNLYSGKVRDKMDSITDRWVCRGPSGPSQLFSAPKAKRRHIS